MCRTLGGSRVAGKMRPGKRHGEKMLAGHSECKNKGNETNEPPPPNKPLTGLSDRVKREKNYSFVWWAFVKSRYSLFMKSYFYLFSGNRSRLRVGLYSNYGCKLLGSAIQIYHFPRSFLKCLSLKKWKFFLPRPFCPTF